MKKTIVLSLVVCILAIGTVGYAFATGLNYTNGVGALSTGDSIVTDANVTGIFWGYENNMVGDITVQPNLSSVRLQFDKYLVKGTNVAVSVYDENGNNIAYGEMKMLANDVAAGGNVSVDITDVHPALVHNIRVSVAEPRPYK